MRIRPGERRGWVLTAGLFFLSLVCGTLAEAAGGALAVDVITLKSGRTLRGAILARQPDGTVALAVAREWLRRADPKDYERQSQRTEEQQRAAWTKLIERIEPLLADPPANQPLFFFLKQERQRIEHALAQDQPAETPFLVVDIPGSQIAKIMPATPERQRLAMFAWDAGLTGVETKPAAELRKVLIDQGVEVDGPLPDLAKQLPARTQSDAEWSARLALVEYTLAESLDFQGMGDTLVRTGDGQQAELAAILPKLLTAQVNALLGDLFDVGAKPRAAEKHSLEPAIAVAKISNQRGFRVTRLELNAERKTVAVESTFTARLDGATWRAIWRHVETADGAKARPDAEARIANDPQVKTALESLKGLGLGADDAVTEAIRIGAATMAAQQAAEGRFLEFRERYVQRLDGPPLMTGAGE